VIDSYRRPYLLVCLYRSCRVHSQLRVRVRVRVRVRITTTLEGPQSHISPSLLFVNPFLICLGFVLPRILLLRGRCMTPKDACCKNFTGHKVHLQWSTTLLDSFCIISNNCIFNFRARSRSRSRSRAKTTNSFPPIIGNKLHSTRQIKRPKLGIRGYSEHDIAF